jgi:hypothetical protein
MSLQDFLQKLETEGPKAVAKLLKELPAQDRRGTGIRLNAALEELKNTPKPEPPAKKELSLDWSTDKMEMRGRNTQLTIKIGWEVYIITGNNLSVKTL